MRAHRRIGRAGPADSGSVAAHARPAYNPGHAALGAWAREGRSAEGCRCSRPFTAMDFDRDGAAAARSCGIRGDAGTLSRRSTRLKKGIPSGSCHFEGSCAINDSDFPGSIAARLLDLSCENPRTLSVERRISVGTFTESTSLRYVDSGRLIQIVDPNEVTPTDRGTPMGTTYEYSPTCDWDVACQLDGTTALPGVWDHLEVSVSILGLALGVNTGALTGAGSLSVGGAFDDEGVRAGGEPVYGGLGEQCVAHHGQPLGGLAV